MKIAVRFDYCAMIPHSLPRLVLLMLYGACLSYLVILSLFTIAAIALMVYFLLETIIYGYPLLIEPLSRRGGYAERRHPPKLPSKSPSAQDTLLPSQCITTFNKLERLGVFEASQPQQSDTCHTPVHDADIEASPPNVFVPGSLTKIDLSGQRNLPIPTRVPCRLVINLDGAEAAARSYRHHKYFFVEWQDAACFEQCVKIAEMFLKSELETKYTSFMSSSHYRIVKKSTLEESNSWLARRRAQERRLGDHSDEIELYPESVSRGTWQWSLPRKLSQQMNTDPDSILFLELSLSYTQYTPHPITACDGNGCVLAIQQCMLRERIKVPTSPLNHVQDAWFLSAKLINNFFTEDLIQHLINRDTQLKQDSYWVRKSQNDKREFIKRVHIHGIRLLACSIMADLDLRCIFHLIENGKQDVDIPLAEADLQLLPYVDPYDLSLAFSRFLQLQGSFMAHSFDSAQDRKPLFPHDQQYQAPRKHEEIKPETVIPLLEVTPHRNGANAAVYRVRLHGDHHDFSPDRNREFAVKHVVRNRELKDLTHESQILAQLAEVPHPHITPLLASWSQLNSCSILLPLAKETLLSMMTTSPGPTLQGCFVRWLLAQMSGLASALDHIHNLGPTGSKPPSKSGDRSMAGVHHDLHPENILVFENDVLKITDFGTARIQQVLGGGKGSYASRKLRCHPGYEAPENFRDHAASRPHDVWALGCIFFEMLVWASGESVQKFAEARQDAQGMPGQVFDDAYWYTVQGEYHLKRAVISKMLKLQIQHQGRHLFRRLLQMVEQMLRIPTRSTKPKPREGTPLRLNISSVLNVLKNMTSQAELDLKQYGEDYFMRTSPEQSGGKFVPPSEVMSREDIGDNDDYRPKGLVHDLLQVPRVSLGSRRKSTGGEFMKSHQFPQSVTATSAQSLSIQTVSCDHQSDLAQAGAHTGDVHHVPMPGTPSLQFTSYDERAATPSSQAPTEACSNGQCAYNPSVPCSHPRINTQERLDKLVGLLQPHTTDAIASEGEKAQ